MRLKSLCLVIGLNSPVWPAWAQLAPQPEVLSLDTWRVHSGDDPRWASPTFDDSQWQTVSYPIQQSFADHTNSFRWYRATILLPPSLQESDLAIGMGPFDEVW